jgi:exosome complex exonuclease RRP6
VDKDYIIDSLVLREAVTESGLKAIFEDPSIVKIFHGSDTDLQLLATDLEIVTVNVFDTARAFQYLQRLPELLHSKGLSSQS